MKKISLLAVSFIFATVLAVSSFAQTGTGKIGWIDTGAFGDEKEGVTKFVGALKALQTELKPRITELQTMDTKIKTIADELAKMQSNTAVPIDQKAALAKQDEGQKLQRDLEYKKKDYDAFASKRSTEVLGPIQNDIFKAIQEFAKAKGYSAILDIAALANENMNAILALDQTTNVTKEFVTYYNTRPATTATTAAPK
ncbi:MAG: OmpH family outer membrane protein [Pyrinomonadaceae bacterium]